MLFIPTLLQTQLHLEKEIKILAMPLIVFNNIGQSTFISTILIHLSVNASRSRNRGLVRRVSGRRSINGHGIFFSFFSP